MSPLPRLPLFLSLGLLAGLCTQLCTQRAMAQAAPPGGLPNAILNATATTPAIDQAIQGFVAAHVGVLTSTTATPAQQSASRKILNSQLRVGVNALAPPINRSYADALNQQALQVFKTADVRAKLNVAIVVAAVAEQAGNTSLEGAVMALLKKEGKDEAAIRIWGMKAAKGVLPPLIQIGRHGALMDQVTAVAKANIADGGMVQDAYQAMTGDPAAAGVVLKPLMDLLGARMALYAQKFPEEAIVDMMPFSYLMDGKVFAAFTPQQQTQVMEACAILMAHAANESKTRPGTQLTEILTLGTAYVYVTASNAGLTELTAKAKVANQNVKNAGQANMGPVVGPFLDDIKKVPQYSKISVPPV